VKAFKRAFKALLLTVLAYLLQVCAMPHLMIQGVVGSVAFAVLAILVVSCGKKYAFCASCLIGAMMESMMGNVPSLYVIAYPAITMLCAQRFADMTDRQLERRRLLQERQQVRLSQRAGKKRWWHAITLRSRDRDLPAALRIPLCAGVMDGMMNIVLAVYMYLIGEDLGLIHITRLAGACLYTVGLAAALMVPCRYVLGMYRKRKRGPGGEAK